MLNRRAFLTRSLITTLLLLSGCSKSQNIFNVAFLKGTIPPQLINDFQKVIAKTDRIKLEPKITLQTIFELLKNWQISEEQKPQSIVESLPVVGKGNKQQANLTTLGDFWLQEAIADGLIQPLNTSSLTAWDSLPQVWHNLVKRDRQGYFSLQGEVYGAPYRYGNCVIAYRKDKLNWTPTDWSDLWREELKGRISLLDSYREVIGLTLKKLGYSYNTDNLSKIDNLTSELQKLHQQVKFYSSDKYLQPLVLGDTWLAIGWSTDILPVVKRYSNIAIAVPESGTSLWADLWVQPTKAQEDTVEESQNKILTTWIDFCWSFKSARQILLFTNALSPIFTEQNTQSIGKDLAQNSVLKDSLIAFNNSEFLLPLSPESTADYVAIWQKIRTA